MNVEPYLCFEGRCEEALDYYQKALGAEVTVKLRFSDSPEPCDPNMLPSGNENKIMHSNFRIGKALLMASDGGCSGSAKFEGTSLALTVPDIAAAEKMFSALADGGQVQMPLTKTFFSPSFGLVSDRFGVPWMVVVEQ